MTTMLDLDAPPAITVRDTHRPALPVAAIVVAVAALSVALGSLLPRYIDPAPAAAVPLLTLEGAGETATATVWFADGTHASAGQAFGHDWRPDRPIRMVTVASPGSCAIQVDQQMVMQDTVGPGQLAVCVWLAPPA